MSKQVICLIIAIFIIGSLISAPAFVFGQDNGAVLNDGAVNQEVDQLKTELKIVSFL